MRAQTNDLYHLKPEVEVLVNEIISCGLYRSIILSGGYGTSKLHSHSDVDLYAISSDVLPFHRYMERVNGQRIEVTVFSYEKWSDILSRQSQPKHHFSFGHGQVLYDPENLVLELREIALSILSNWSLSPEDLETQRNDIAIQKDKLNGWIEKKEKMQVRYHSIGVVHLASQLLVSYWEGYPVDGGKNLSRSLGHQKCTTKVRDLFHIILMTCENSEMSQAALELIDEVLDITGGSVLVYHGGIPLKVAV